MPRQFYAYLFVAAAVAVFTQSIHAATNLDVMTVGDSLVYGFNTDIVPTAGYRETDGGWRAPLYAELLTAGFTVDMLGDADTDPNIPGTVMVSGNPVPFDYHNEGHIGWQIDATARTEVPDVPNGSVPLNEGGGSNHGLHEYVAAGFFDANLAAADFTVLQIGANDLRRGIVNAYSDGTLRGNQSGHASTADRLDALIGTMVGKIDSNAMLFVANVAPVAENSDPFSGYDNLQPGGFSGDLVNDAINQFNSEFATLFDGDGVHLLYDNVMLVDAWSLFFEGGDQRGTYLHADGLHWLTPANEAFAGLISNKIQTIVPEPASLALCLVGFWGCMARRGRRGH